MWDTRMLALSSVPPGPPPYSCWGHPLCSICEGTSTVVCVWEEIRGEGRTVKEPSQSNDPLIPLWGLKWVQNKAARDRDREGEV